MQKIGFIGVGNMGGAILRRLLTGSYKEHHDAVFFTNRDQEKGKKLSKEWHCTRKDDVESLIEAVDVVVLAIKPQQLKNLSAASLNIIKQKKPLVISLLAGVQLKDLEHTFGMARIIRVMPNTAAQIGESMSILSCPDTLADEDIAYGKNIFSECGDVIVLDEAALDMASAISGCGPAFFYVVAEAMADAGVSLGLPRDTALKLVAQTMKGSGGMLAQSQKSPAVLKDQVTSPGGTTIAGVLAMENAGVRFGMADAVLAAYVKNTELASLG